MDLASCVRALAQGGHNKQAHDRIEQLSESSDYVPQLMEIIINDATPVDERLLVMIFLKNQVISKWALPGDHPKAMPEGLKNGIKQHLLNLYPRVPEMIFRQLLPTFAYIGNLEFPVDWPECMALMSQNLTVDFPGPPPEHVLRCMDIFQELMQKYRDTMRNEDVLWELKTILNSICDPETNIYKTRFDFVCKRLGNERDGSFFRYACSVLELFRSLHTIDIPEHFEDNLDFYFKHLIQICHHEGPEMYEVIAAACGCIKEYAERYQQFLQPYVVEVSMTLGKLLVSLPIDCDNVAIVAMEVISLVLQTNWQTNNPFQDDVCRDIINQIVLRHLTLSQNDLSSAEESPREFAIMELDDRHTVMSRRTAALDVAACMSERLTPDTTSLVLNHVHAMLGSTTGTPQEKVLMREAGLSLFTSMVAGGVTSSMGARTLVTSQDVFLRFYKDHVKPLLRKYETDWQKLLLCSAIKFLIVFRIQLPKGEMVSMVDGLLSLGDDDELVRVYLLTCAEKMFSTRLAPKVYHFEPAVGDALASKVLVKCVKYATEAPVDEKEAELRCAVRCMWYLGERGGTLYGEALPLLVGIHQQMVQKEVPSHPLFVHFLYEALAATVRRVLPVNPAAVGTVFPHLISAAQKIESDYVPYVYQIMGFLVEKSVSVDVMKTWVQTLCNVERWTGSVSTVPGLLRVLTGYFKCFDRYADVIEPNMEAIVTRFGACLSNRHFVMPGFNFFDTVVIHSNIQFLQKHLRSLMLPILHILHRSKDDTAKCKRAFVSLCTVLAKSEQCGMPGLLLDVLDDIQKGMHDGLFCRVLFPVLPTIGGPGDRRLALVGLGVLLKTGRMTPDEMEAMRQCSFADHSNWVADAIVDVDDTQQPFMGSFNNLISIDFRETDRSRPFENLFQLGQSFHQMMPRR